MTLGRSDDSEQESTSERTRRNTWVVDEADVLERKRKLMMEVERTRKLLADMDTKMKEGFSNEAYYPPLYSPEAPRRLGLPGIFK